jgi:hypothetical protein
MTWKCLGCGDIVKQNTNYHYNGEGGRMQGRIQCSCGSGSDALVEVPQ